MLCYRVWRLHYRLQRYHYIRQTFRLWHRFSNVSLQACYLSVICVLWLHFITSSLQPPAVVVKQNVTSYSILNRFFFQIEFIRGMLCVMDSSDWPSSIDSATGRVVVNIEYWEAQPHHRHRVDLAVANEKIMIFSLLATTLQLVAINNAQGIG